MSHTKRLLIALPLALVLQAGGSAAQRNPAAHALLTYVAANRGICLVRADGTQPVRLTPRWRGLGTPAWSPRGRYVAFRRSVGLGRAKIAVADARAHVLWKFGTWDQNGTPLWSPDGRHIAYRGADANGSNGFDVARPDGSYDHRVLQCDSTECGVHPSWSFNGQRIAFVDWSNPNPVSIFSTRADGSDRRLLVADAQQPAYSPAEATLAYTASNGSSRASLFIANADGSDRRPLTPPSLGEVAWPVWSPDGQFLSVFVWPARGNEGKIVVVRADGTGKPVVIASDVPLDTYLRAGLMAWSPGGKLIAFMRGRSLVVASADGGKERVLVSHVGNVGVSSDGVGTEAWRPGVALPAAKRPVCPRR